MSWCTDTGKRRKRWDMSEASLTEFTMFGNEYEAVDSNICDGCVFFSKEGRRCHRYEIVRSASVHGDLSCSSVERTDGRDVIFVKKSSKPYKTDCGSVTNGDLLRRMNNRELADVIGFFARWMQRADIGENNYSEYMLRWLSSLGTPGDADAKSRRAYEDQKGN